MVQLEMTSWKVEGRAKVEEEEARLKREGFHEVSPTTKLGHKEYRVTDRGGEMYDVESVVDTEADQEEEGSGSED